MKLPTELEPVLAKLSCINDLGVAQWYEVIYYDPEEGKWCSYAGSDTFDTLGITVLDWEYCDKILPFYN